MLHLRRKLVRPRKKWGKKAAFSISSNSTQEKGSLVIKDSRNPGKGRMCSEETNGQIQASRILNDSKNLSEHLNGSVQKDWSISV